MVLCCKKTTHLRLVAEDQLVVYGGGKVINSEPQPRSFQSANKSRASPDDRLIRRPLTGNELQWRAGIQRNVPLQTGQEQPLKFVVTGNRR